LQPGCKLQPAVDRQGGAGLSLRDAGEARDLAVDGGRKKKITIEAKDGEAAPTAAEQPAISMVGVATPLAGELRLTADPGDPARTLAARLGALPLSHDHHR